MSTNGVTKWNVEPNFRAAQKVAQKVPPNKSCNSQWAPGADAPWGFLASEMAKEWISMDPSRRMGVLDKTQIYTSGEKGLLSWLVPRAWWTGGFIGKHLENHKLFKDPAQAWCSFSALTFCVACSLTLYDFLTTSCSSPLKNTIKTVAVLSEQNKKGWLKAFTPSIVEKLLKSKEVDNKLWQPESCTSKDFDNHTYGFDHVETWCPGQGA